MERWLDLNSLNSSKCSARTLSRRISGTCCDGLPISQPRRGCPPGRRTRRPRTSQPRNKGMSLMLASSPIDEIAPAHRPSALLACAAARADIARGHCFIMPSRIVVVGSDLNLDVFLMITTIGIMSTMRCHMVDSASRNNTTTSVANHFAS